MTRSYGAQIGRQVAVDWMTRLPREFVPDEYRVEVLEARLARIAQSLGMLSASIRPSTGAWRSLAELLVYEQFAAKVQSPTAFIHFDGSGA